MDEEKKAMGGARPGSGRKKTGKRRQPRSYSLNAEEMLFMDWCLAWFRDTHPDPPVELKKAFSFYGTKEEKKIMADFFEELRNGTAEDVEKMKAQIAEFKRKRELKKTK